MITLAFTRPLRRLDESVEMAKSYGFEVVAGPSLDIIHGSKSSYDRIKWKLSQKVFRTAIFSSATAVEECNAEWGDEFSGLFEGTEVIAIGPGTSKKLTAMRIEVSSIPGEYTSSGLVEHLKRDADGRNVLIVHSDKGSSILIDGLNEAGFTVEELIAYTLEKHAGGLDRIREAAEKDAVDVYAFTSRMSVESFLDDIGVSKEIMFKRAKVAAIGKPTKERLEEEGIDVEILPKEATFPCLLETIKRYFEKEASE